MGRARIFSYDLFKLDDEISKFKNITEKEIVHVKTSPISISSTLAQYRELEKEFETFLRKITPYERDVRFRDAAGIVFHVDFVIPSKNNPKFIIELKRSVRFRSNYERGIIYRHFKQKYGSKTILIGDLSSVGAVERVRLLEVWDYILDLKNLEELNKIFELES